MESEQPSLQEIVDIHHRRIRNAIALLNWELYIWPFDVRYFRDATYQAYDTIGPHLKNDAVDIIGGKSAELTRILLTNMYQYLGIEPPELIVLSDEENQALYDRANPLQAKVLQKITQPGKPVRFVDDHTESGVKMELVRDMLADVGISYQLIAFAGDTDRGYFEGMVVGSSEPRFFAFMQTLSELLSGHLEIEERGQIEITDGRGHGQTLTSDQIPANMRDKYAQIPRIIDRYDFILNPEFKGMVSSIIDTLLTRLRRLHQ